MSPRALGVAMLAAAAAGDLDSVRALLPVGANAEEHRRLPLEAAAE